MSKAFASWPFRRNALACCLCLLVLAFAMEAKLARYSRQGGRRSDVAAAKACTAEFPEVESHGDPALDPSHPQIPFKILSTSPSARFLSADALMRSDIEYYRDAVSTAAYFSQDLFSRPPPLI
jgi:hypothetical protein